MRVSNSVTLTVLFNNLDGKTQVKAIHTGSSPGETFNFHWVMAEDFPYTIKLHQRSALLINLIKEALKIVLTKFLSGKKT
ncbi:hypothetical protein Clocel_2265 [Clostridium cellulovorans 743B]|uniref:Uncharacterized protein n=1 Tax=Clostridium cellulovorans (strain ATCC 35296 / DSM 3052 / OCM 3 / 743B) TaxID=573061 RepID=D9SP38_CLOC7|nr:hypothetical protein Clocel_2265 [Clostridium cellulovorans 743B]